MLDNKFYEVLTINFPETTKIPKIKPNKIPILFQNNKLFHVIVISK